MSGGASPDAIREVLDEIMDPCSVATSVPMGLAEMGLVKSVEVAQGGRVEIELRLTSPFCEMVPYMKREAERRVADLPGVSSVEVRHDSGLDWDHDMIDRRAQERRRRRLQAIADLPRP